MNNETSFIWEEITKNFEFFRHIVKKITDEQKLFFVKIYQNDIKYIESNCSKIIGHNIINLCFLLSLSCSDNTQFIIFLINKLKIDFNKNRNNFYFLNVCIFIKNVDIIKDMIHILKIDMLMFKKSKLLIQLCTKNINLPTIKFLIEEIKIDASDYDKYNRNCLLNCCLHNDNLDTIKYFIENLNLNIDFCDKNGNNCLLEACKSKSKQNHLIVKYLIEEKGMKPEYCNNLGKNCLLEACKSNSKQNHILVSYLLEEQGMNTEHCDKQGNNCLLEACKSRSNKNHILVKYLINKYTMDINYQNKSKKNCLMISCTNYNPLLIKYLIEEIKMEIEDEGLLYLACEMNVNLEVIKYIIENKISDIQYEKKYSKNNCLLLACKRNPNPKIIKYLIEDVKMDIFYTNKYSENCLLVGMKNPNNDVVKYLINHFIIHGHIIHSNRDIEGNNCLLLACKRFDCFDTIKYLIEEIKMDPLVLNNDGNNCLTMMCEQFMSYSIIYNMFRINKPLNNNQILANKYIMNLIKYFIEKTNINPFHTNNKGKTCLLILCHANAEMNIIKYLIEDIKMDASLCLISDNRIQNLHLVKYLIESAKIDIEQTNSDANDCLMQICIKNRNIDIIKYLIESVKMNPNKVNNNLMNCLLIVCKNNNNLNIIKYLIEEIKMDVNHIDIEGNNCLLLSCMKSCSDLELIKYLVDEIKIDTSYRNLKGDNCLTILFKKTRKRSIDYDIIKYLLEEIKMDANHIDIEGNNYLILSCVTGNPDLNLIKYLVEESKIHTSYKNLNGNNCLSLLLNHIYIGSNELNIIIYLIQNTNIDLSTIKIHKNILKKLIPQFTNNYSKLNQLLNNAINTFQFITMNKILSEINPIIIDKMIREIFNIKNPFDDTYETFLNNVKKFECKIPTSVFESYKTNTKTNKKKINYTKQTQILFKYNNKYFYGHKHIVYGCMCLLEYLCDYNFDSEEEIVLNSSTSIFLPDNIICMYIRSCYNVNTFNINDILGPDFINFLKFLDQYPTKTLSIDLLEHNLIQWIDIHIKEKPFDIDINYIKNICDKYKLKYLCLFLSQFKQ